MEESKSTIFDISTGTLSSAVETQIRNRAYQIYEDRGLIEGHELEDWLQAEAEIMSRMVIRKATAA